MVDDCVSLIIFGIIAPTCLVLLPVKLSDLKQEWKRKKLMKDTYKKYKGLWIPRGAEDRGFQRAETVSSTDNCCHQPGWTETRCGGISCTDCILCSDNEKVADTYYRFKVARTFQDLFVPDTVDEDYIPQSVNSLLPGYVGCRRNSASNGKALCSDRCPSVSCKNCILNVSNVEVASTFFKNNNNKKKKEMKSKLITYDRVFELPSSMLDRGRAAGDAERVSYAVLLTMPSADTPRIPVRSVQGWLARELGYAAYVITTRSGIDTIAVTFSTEISAKDALMRINKWAATAYPVEESESSVSQFCEDIDACKEGREFASKYDTLADLWDGMVDNDKNGKGYLSFVVKRLEDDQQLRLRYISNTQAWPSVTAACCTVSTGPLGHSWLEIFTADYLKSINPFRK